MKRAVLARVAVLSLVSSLVAAGVAQAAPVTINFESGAGLGEAVTNQYGAPGTPAGPVFRVGTEDGFKGLTCSPPHLVNAFKAHSGTHELKLDGCEGGEFWPSDAFFSLGYSSERVEFWVASDTPLAGSTVTSTTFNAKGERLEQKETSLKASSEPAYEKVTFKAAGPEIAAVAVQLGTNFGAEPGSSTGVTEGHGNTDVLLDDLTYYPPASPPESSFRLGANPSAVATTAGNQVSVNIPVVWTNNPEPSNNPIQLEASAVPGVEASFSPNPTSTGTSTLTLKIAKNAVPGPHVVTVAGHVVGEPERKASVEIRLEVSSAIELSGVGAVKVVPCTPRQVTLHVLTASYVTEPVTLEVGTLNQPGVTITAISGGEVLSPGRARVVATPKLTTSGGEVTTTMTLTVTAGTKPAGPVAWEATAFAGEYAEAFALGTLAIGAGEIDEADVGTSSFAATTVSTPALHQPGSQLTLHGSGFCPGTKVAIGDALEGGETENDATPESIAPNGTTLTFRAPRGAITGPIQALAGGATPIDGPSLTVRTFRNTYGFSWKNHDYGLRLNDELGDELFGQNETNFEPVPGWLVRKPEAVLFEEMTNKHIPGGICFGMAFTSLLMHEFPGEVFRFPRTGGNDAWHLDSASMPSEPLLRAVTENFSLQFTDQLIPAELNAVLGIHGTNDDINAIEEELAAGHPVEIGLIHWSGLSVEGHSVLAYDSRPYPGGGTVVYLANSNIPYGPGEESSSEAHNLAQFDNSEIVIKEGNWTFPEGAQFKGHVPWSGSEADMVVYRHHELPFINGERPHLPNLATATVMAIFGSAADGVTQLSDGHGSLFSGGTLAPRGSWPKGVAPLPDFTSQATPLQLVSFNPKLAGPLTATVARSAGGGAMSFNLPGLQASLQAGSHAGQRDRVTVDPRSDTVGYQSSTAHATLAGSLLSAPGAAAGARASTAARTPASDHLAQFHTTSSHGGQLTFSFPQGRTFVARSTGGSSSLSLTLSAISTSGAPVAVQLPTTRLGNGATLRVAPADWRALGSAAVRITLSIHGHTSSRSVKGRTLAKRFASIRSVALTSLGGRHYRLEVALSARHAPKQASLSVAASVLSHGRLLEQASANRLSGSTLNLGQEHLLLPKPLAPGRYTLKLRLLEITANGPAQGSVVVSKTLSVRAH
jgi:hypothetical protein